MAVKGIILCALACLLQTTASQRLGRGFNNPFGSFGRRCSQNSFGLRKNCEYAFPAKCVTATSGGSLPVDSASAIPPCGVAVASENMYEGTLASVGELPFVGTVAIEGVLPTVGTGIVNYKCGNEVSLLNNPTQTSVGGLGSITGVALNGCGPTGVGVTAPSGGRLPVKSASSTPPVGVALASENMYEGTLKAVGELPFVGTVGIEGVLPTCGTGIVNYSCGSGTTSITAINSPAIDIVTGNDCVNSIPTPIKYISAAYNVGAPFNTCGTSALAVSSSSGGRLPVKSASALPPVGVAVASENMYEGILCATGELPFVGTVGAEGLLPTVGIGAVRYGCGNGISAMAASKFGCRSSAGRRYRY